MKYLLTLIIIFYFSNLGWTQTIWETKIPTVLNKVETFNQSIVDSDDNIISVGYAMSDDGFNDFYIVKSNGSNGDMIWEKRLDFGGEEKALSIALASDGVVVAGFKFENKDSYSKGLILKLDFDGNIVWEKIWETTYHAVINSVEVNSAGQIFAAGYQTPSTNDQPSIALLLSINSDGSQMTELNNEFSNLEIESLERVILNPNEEILLAGTLADGNIFFQINESGVVQSIYESSGDFSKLALVFFDGSSLYVTLEDYPFNSDFKIVKYNASGQIELESDVLSYGASVFANLHIENNEIRIDRIRTYSGDVRRFQYSSIDLSLLNSVDYSMGTEDFNATSIILTSTEIFFIGDVSIDGQKDARLAVYSNGYILNWDKVYGINNGTHEEAPGAIISDINGGYIIQYVKVINEIQTCVVSKISEDGVILWETIIPGTTGHDNWGRLFQSKLGDGSIYLLFYVGRPGIGVGTDLCKLNENGSVQWVKEVLLSNPRGFKGGLCELPNGNIVASVQILQLPNNRLSNLVFFDTDGNLLNQKTIGDGFKVYETKDMILTSDGNLAVAGYATYQNNGFVRNPIVTKYDTEGNLIWENVIPDTVVSGFGYYNSIKETSNNKLILGGGIITNIPAAHPLHASFSLNGDLNYLKIEENTPSFLDFRLYGTAVTPTNEVFHVGFELETSSEPYSGWNSPIEGWILKTDLDGNTIFEQSIKAGKSTFLADVCPSPDGGAVVIGSEFISESSDVFILKIGADGTTSLPINISSPWNLSVFPNPTVDVLNIQFDDSLQEEVRLRLINLNGSVLLQKEIPIGSQQEGIDISEFPKGMFFIEVHNSSFKKTVGIIKN